MQSFAVGMCQKPQREMTREQMSEQEDCCGSSSSLFARCAQVEGIFSGTLSYIFNSFVEGTSFSGIVAEAKAAGFTEPDPRDDLAGMDVARKVTILARWESLPCARVC